MSPVHSIVDSPFPHDWKEEANDSFYNSDKSPDLISAISLGITHAYNYHPLLPESEDPVLPISSIASGDYRTPEDDYCSENSWHATEVKNWGAADVIHWVNYEASLMNLCCTEIQAEKFAKLSGEDLLAYREKDFEELDRKYGQHLYKRLQQLISGEMSPCNDMHSLMLVPSGNGINDNSVITTHDLDSKYEMSEPLCINIKHEILSSPMENITNLDVDHDVYKSNEQLPEKKKPGRPKGIRKRKPSKEKLGRLWEFIRDLLKNKDYCPSLIVWDNYEEGMFRFVRSDQVAKLWGSKKDNPGMTYEKLSRAMRYYYKSKVLQPVLGRRLVYKFGPTATGWQVDNPNFKH